MSLQVLERYCERSAAICADNKGISADEVIATLQLWPAANQNKDCFAALAA